MLDPVLILIKESSDVSVLKDFDISCVLDEVQRFWLALLDFLLLLLEAFLVRIVLT